MSPKELLIEAEQIGLATLALTDINFSGACQDFVRLALKYGIKPVVGVDFRIENVQLYVCLAINNEGFRIINKHLSAGLAEKQIPLEPPCSEHVLTIYPLDRYDGRILTANEYIGIDHKNLSKIPFYKHKIPAGRVVILHTVTFRNKRDFNAHRLLRAIDQNTLLSKLSPHLQGAPADQFLPYHQYTAVYRKYADAITRTCLLLDRCAVEFCFDGTPKNQTLYTQSTANDQAMIRELCATGLPYRYPQMTAEIQARIEKELNIIEEKGYTSYFLINWRIAQYARGKGYFYVGRGSGANSIVAYLLRITDVDPIALDLYFERFINLYRKNPPDFDLDFSWQDREDITQFIFNEFKHVSLLGTYSTFKHRAVYRELGKVFGLPSQEIEKIQSEGIPTSALDSLSQLVRKYGHYIQGQPSHISIHAGGILISEKDIHYETATELPPKGFPTTQFDMVTAEDIGLYKFDILSQRGLGKIKDCLEIVRYNKPEDPVIDIHNIPKLIEDPAVKDLLREGKALGCFYVESPAMRMLLKKLRVDDYLGLVAASSVIRPGVAQSGMMREYILRFRYPERRNEAHPILQEIMPETFGVMVYQEDVIKVAHYYAGLTLGEADVLRRGMSGKYRSREEFQQVRSKFFHNAITRGHSRAETKEIWRQIESFAGYAFAKGHSASYAVESYQSLFLKAYYPLEYMVATVNNGGGFYRPEIYLHEAQMHGATIHEPCVNTSLPLTTIQGKDIYLGFHTVKSLEVETMNRLLSARADGPFIDFYDCTQRAQLSLEQAITLIRVRAFRFTGKTKKELLWKAHFLLEKKVKKLKLPELFHQKPKDYSLPSLSYHRIEDAFDAIELLGYPLCNPFDLVRTELPPHPVACDLPRYLKKTITTYGYLVTIKNTKTSKGKYMNFGTFLDRDGYFLDTVHFPPVAKKYPFRGKGIYKIVAKVVEEFDFYSLEVLELYREHYMDDPRFADEKVA